ncbi:MAG: ribosomal protein S18-alanine N-acetyltransferase [Pleurocapsa sp.]
MEILVIKPITQGDLSLTVALDQVCFDGLWAKEAYLREIDSPNSSLLGLWLQHGDRPKLIGIGCLWSIVEEAHITLLGIHPDYQKQGLGQFLLLTLLQDGVVRQLEWATLEVNAHNLPAISLYQKFGFAIAGKRPKYYQKTGEDALILWRKGLDKLEFQQQLNLWQKQVRDRLYPNYRIDFIGYGKP